MGQAIRDESGKLLGYFLTEAEYGRALYGAVKTGAGVVRGAGSCRGFRMT